MVGENGSIMGQDLLLYLKKANDDRGKNCTTFSLSMVCLWN